MLEAFRYETFRAIWLAMLVSNFGTMIQGATAAWLMTQMTTSHLLVSLIQASTALPAMIFGVVAGAVADNFDRRKIMLFAQTIMLGLSITLAVLTASGLTTPAILLILMALLGCGTALNQPAWHASIRMQVDKASLPHAITLNIIANNLARSAGPALGGIILVVWSAQAGFATNAVSYLAIIWVLARWKPVATPIDRRPIGHAIVEGFVYALRTPPIRRIFIRIFVFALGSSSITSLMPIVTKDLLQGNAGLYGSLLGAYGLGSVLAAVTFTRVRLALGNENAILVASAASALAALGLALGKSDVLVLTSSFCAGCAWTMTMGTMNVGVQMRADERILGRTLSLFAASGFAGIAVGSYIFGAIAQQSGVVIALECSSVFLIASLALRFFAPTPDSRREPDRS